MLNIVSLPLFGGVGPNPSNKSIIEDGAVGEVDEIVSMEAIGALLSCIDNKSPFLEPFCTWAGVPIDNRSKRISAPACDGCIPETDRGRGKQRAQRFRH